MERKRKSGQKSCKGLNGKGAKILQCVALSRSVPAKLNGKLHRRDEKIKFLENFHS